VSKQIPLATITTLILSACCSTLSQGATSLNVPNAASAPLESTALSANPVNTPDISTAISSVLSAATSSVTALPERVLSAASAPSATKPLTKTNKPVAKVIAKPVARPIKKPATPAITVKPAKPATKTTTHTATVHQRPVEHNDTQNATFNRPYVAFGEQFTPIQNPSNFRQRGEATWYSKSHQGLPTINGEIYDVYGMTAAHPTLPIPSYAKVINMMNHKSVVVRINDRGPFDYNKKIIELSFSAANKLGMVGNSNRQVEIVGLESETPITTKPKAPITFNFAPERTSTKATTKPIAKATVKPTVKTAAKSAAPIASNIEAGIYLQLGAFKSVDAAQKFMQKVRDQLGKTAYPLTSGLQEKLQRVRIGPYPSADEAHRAAEDMATPLGFKPLVKQVN
jgi:rare lipoprotein A